MLILILYETHYKNMISSLRIKNLLLLKIKSFIFENTGLSFFFVFLENSEKAQKKEGFFDYSPNISNLIEAN